MKRWCRPTWEGADEILPVLELENVSVTYGKAVGVKALSLGVGSGEAVGVIGPNGAGKTSLLRAVAGLNRCSGTVRFHGEVVSGRPAFEIARRGMILCPEGRGLFPELTVRQNMDLGAYRRNDARAVALDLEKAFSLFPVLRARSTQLAQTLSGGEQQMLAIARAIMAAPELLMLDEPSIGLALMVKESIAESILEVNREGVTVLLMEQDVHLAMDIVSRLYLLENGRIRLQGVTEDLRHNAYIKDVYLGIS